MIKYLDCIHNKLSVDVSVFHFLAIAASGAARERPGPLGEKVLEDIC